MRYRKASRLPETSRGKYRRIVERSRTAARSSALNRPDKEIALSFVLEIQHSSFRSFHPNFRIRSTSESRESAASFLLPDILTVVTADVVATPGSLRSRRPTGQIIAW
jgi:hypothetical protein